MKHRCIALFHEHVDACNTRCFITGAKPSRLCLQMRVQPVQERGHVLADHRGHGLEATIWMALRDACGGQPPFGLESVDSLRASEVRRVLIFPGSRRTPSMRDTSVSHTPST